LPISSQTVTSTWRVTLVVPVVGLDDPVGDGGDLGVGLDGVHVRGAVPQGQRGERQGAGADVGHHRVLVDRRGQRPVVRLDAVAVTEHRLVHEQVALVHPASPARRPGAIYWRII
jgi:hypothetical protein